jgi:hypothetical protein
MENVLKRKREKNTNTQRNKNGRKGNKIEKFKCIRIMVNIMELNGRST